MAISLTSEREIEQINKGIRDILNVKGLSLNLTNLNLANNKIDLLPESFFAQCSSLKHLNLSNNRIHVIPNGIIQLKYLTWLNLGCNNIVELPPQFGNLIQLYHLDLSQNQLTLKSIPKSFFELKVLERLYLSDNAIEKITADFGKLGNLRILAIRDNKLEQINRDISRIIYLRELFIEGNQLRLLPPELAELEELVSENGVFCLTGNPWILPIQEQSKLGPSHVMTYLSGATYKIVYGRNK